MPDDGATQKQARRLGSSHRRSSPAHEPAPGTRFGENSRTVAHAQHKSSPASTSFDTLARKKTGAAGDEERTPKGGAVPLKGDALDLIFIVFDAGGYVAEVAAYIENNLPGQKYELVTDIRGIFRYLEKEVLPSGKKVGRIRIVTHGWETGDVAISPKRTSRREMSPQEVVDFAKDKQKLVHAVMATDAVVEFWGCSIGKSEQANEAWAHLFQSDFTSTTGLFHTSTAPTFPLGDPHYVKSLDDFAQRFPNDDNALAAFVVYLLDIYNRLVAKRAIVPVTGGPKAILLFMRKLFDDSGGRIRMIGVEPTKGAPIVEPDQKEWKSLWVTYTPIRRAALIKGEAGATPSTLAPPPAPGTKPPAAPPKVAAAPPSTPAPTPTAPPKTAPPKVAPPKAAPPKAAPPKAAPPKAAPPKAPRREHAPAADRPPPGYHRERSDETGGLETLVGGEWYRVWGFDIGKADVEKPAIQRALDQIRKSQPAGGPPPKITIYGSESASRREGRRGEYGEHRAEEVVEYFRKHGIDATVAPGDGVAPSLPAPIDLGHPHKHASPEEKSHWRAVIIHVERPKAPPPPKPTGDPHPQPEPKPQSWWPLTEVIERTFEVPVLKNPYVIATLEFKFKIQLVAMDVRAKASFNLAKKKLELELKKQLGESSEVKAKGGYDFKKKQWELKAKLAFKLWEHKVSGELETRHKAEAGLELDVARPKTIVTPVYGTFYYNPPIYSFEVAGSHFEATAGVEVTLKLGGPAVYAVLAGAAVAAFQYFNVLSLGEANRKGDIEAVGHDFARGYAQMVVKLATQKTTEVQADEARLKLHSPEWRDRILPKAVDQYVKEHWVGAQTRIEEAGMAAAYQHIKAMGPPAWEALRQQLLAKSGGNEAVLYEQMRDRIFLAVSGYLGNVSGHDLLHPGELEVKDMWKASHDELMP